MFDKLSRASFDRRRPARMCGLMLLVFLPACRTPHWCATRALGCLPVTADSTAGSFWQRCDSQWPSASKADASTAATRPPLPVATIQTAAPLRVRLVSTSPAFPRVDQDESASDKTESSSRQSSAGQNHSPSDRGQSTATASTMPAEAKSNPFQLPSILPGAETPALRLPRQLDEENATGEQREQAEKDRAAAYSKLYPPLSPAQTTIAIPDAAAGAMGLEQLQQLTRENHPGIRAASAAVETARGKMIQAGLPPNPNIGYEADTVRTAFTNGYHGAYIQQTIITARKLGLAAEAAAVDHANANLELRKTWYTAISEVRRQYFNTLVARQRHQLAEALYQLSERAYQTQIELVRAGDAAPYEPLQLRVLTTQAKATLIQAQQDAIAAWRSLAAATGVPNLQPANLEGRIDCQVPSIEYDSALSRLLALHTDLQTARNLVGRNRTLVTLADRTPIPDINAGVVLQHDYTFNPGTTTYNIVLGGALPVFDRNQGNRVAARAELVRASQSVADTENQLISQLAPAYAKYQANRELASSFRTDALADQVRAYRGIYQRYHTDPTGISFNDIIVAQQTLAATLTQYLTILQAQWLGTVEIGELLQVDDLFQLGPPLDVAQIPAITVDN